MTDKSVHDATEEWVRHSIAKEFTPIDINDVYKAFSAGAQWQSQQAQGEAEAVQHFVNSMIDAFECGFIDSNTLTLATIYQVMRNHCKDGFGIEVEPLVVAWGETTARECAAPPAPSAVPEGQAIGLLARVQGWWQNTDGDMPASLEQDIAALLTACPNPDHAAEADVCQNCETALPEGCGGIFAHTGTACRYGENQQEETER